MALLTAAAIGFQMLSGFAANSENEHRAEAEAAYQKALTSFKLDAEGREAARRRGDMIATMNKAGRGSTGFDSFDVVMGEQAGEDALNMAVIRYEGAVGVGNAESAADIYRRRKFTDPIGTLLGSNLGSGLFKGKGTSLLGPGKTSASSASKYLSQTYGQGNFFSSSLKI